MKNTLTLIVTLCVCASTFGQSKEFGVSLNSGLFWFRGTSADKTSYLSYDETRDDASTGSSFGTSPGLNYGLSVNYKRIGERNFVFGIDLGYERLKSNTKVDHVYRYSGAANNRVAATGHIRLISDFINLFPHFGYRIKAEKMSFDVVGGLDLAYCVRGKERGKAEDANGVEYRTSYSGRFIDGDIRPRVQVTANYRDFSVYVGYSRGLLNYMYDYVGGSNNKVFANVFRFGATYRLK